MRLYFARLMRKIELLRRRSWLCFEDHSFRKKELFLFCTWFSLSFLIAEQCTSTVEEGGRWFRTHTKGPKGRKNGVCNLTTFVPIGGTSCPAV